MTIEQVANLVADGWSPSTLGRWETGDRRIRPADLRSLLDVYEVTEEAREAMMTLAREARQRGWWQAYGDVLPSEYGTYIGLETESTSLQTYQQQLIEGIVQTERYARAVIRAARPDDDDVSIDRRVALRMDRQSVLTGAEPMKLWAILDEAAVRRVVGGPEVMREQLEWLAEVAERPGIHLQVLPFSAGAHAAMASSFVILGFESLDPDVVYVDAGTSALFIEDEKDVSAYKLTFDHLRASALSPNESQQLFRVLAQELT